MDSVLNAALEEICSQVEHGLTLQSLWSKLHSSHSSPLTTSFQKSIFTNLLRIPTLRFEPPIPKFDANHGNIKIFPQQTLANNFVGLYDPQLLQQAQLRVLHLLANAKHDGITQTQLSKLLKIDPNNFHYVLRSLECKGLIVKRSALEKKKQIGGISTSSSYVPTNISTNLVYLRRYAKSIAEHQRFELQITQFNNPDQKSELQTNVVLADYEPQIKAISDKLANANGKVLIFFHSILIQCFSLSFIYNYNAHCINFLVGSSCDCYQEGSWLLGIASETKGLETSVFDVFQNCNHIFCYVAMDRLPYCTFCCVIRLLTG